MKQINNEHLHLNDTSKKNNWNAQWSLVRMDITLPQNNTIVELLLSILNHVCHGLVSIVLQQPYLFLLSADGQQRRAIKRNSTDYKGRYRLTHWPLRDLNKTLGE